MWRGPLELGEFPTLGYEVGAWVESHCVIPDGEHQGEPLILTDEMWQFLVWHYRLKADAYLDVMKPSAPFVFRRSQLVRPQKWGKGPFAAAMICAEAAGPVLFAGWDAHGEPVGRPWATPWIQVTAVSEGQTDNIWRALMPMIQLGPLVDVMPDVGLERVNLPGGGFIEPVTSNALSRLGQRITFDVHDETQNWFRTNRGHWLAETKRRNLAGMGGRSIETTNAYDPAQDSVAQRTAETKRRDVYRDNRRPPDVDTADQGARREAMAFVYGDSARARPDAPWKAWVDLDRIDAEWQEIAEHDRPQADRFFCNVIGIGSGSAFDPDRWRSLAKAVDVADGTKIVLGFDGARFFDSTALIGTTIDDGHQFVVGLWERPDVAHDDWGVDAEEVDATMKAAFERWKVYLVYADPPHWDPLIDAWAGRWGPRRVKAWWTNRPKQMAHAIRAYAEAMSSGELSHDGHLRFADHIANARKRETTAKDDDGRPMWVISKEHPKSVLKIDAAVAGCLSWEARRDAIAAGAMKQRARAIAF